MKILIFAGGAGTRLWPLSRKDLPKQFNKMFEGKSTVQLAVERVAPTFGYENVYISTNDNYVNIAKEQLPQIPEANIVGEPAKRDLSAAIGFNFIRLKKLGYSGPVAILWSDHLMKNPENFISALKKGQSLISEDPNRLIFIGEKARYAENNLGWIHIGEKLEEGLNKFVEWTYKPELEKCKQIFASGEWRWNPGYFIVDLDFTLNLYKEYLPGIYAKLQIIANSVGTSEEEKVLKKVYPTLDSVHFDKGIIEKVPAEQALVIDTDMGWADPGTLYALKEALTENREENLEKGLTFSYNSKDCLIINEDENKLVAVNGLEGMVVVNTKDALLVIPKEKVLEITSMVKELENEEKFSKFV